MNKMKVWRLSSVLLIIAIFIMTIMIIVPRGIAGFFFYPADKALLRWELDGSISEREKNRVNQWLKLAGHWDDANPDIIEAKGRQLDFNLQDQYFWQTPDSSSYREALGHFTRAAQLRPSSPWPWINIALMKARLREFDDLFEASIRQAAVTGPWEPSVNVRIADTAFSGWHELSGPTREVSMRAIQRGLKQDRKSMLEVVRHHLRLPWLCRNLPGGIEQRDICPHPIDKKAI